MNALYTRKGTLSLSLSLSHTLLSFILGSTVVNVFKMQKNVMIVGKWET